MNRTATLLTILLLTAAAELSLADSSTLAHNPFARPPSAASFTPRAETDDPVLAFELLATMVVDSQGLANVGGRILRPGDVTQGTTLLKVFEDRAVFLRNGKRLTIYVKPEMVEADE